MLLHRITRWALFFPGKILDYLVILAQLFYLPYFLLKVKPKVQALPLNLKRKDTLEEIIKKAVYAPTDKYKFIGNDDHTLLIQDANGKLFPERAKKLIEQVVRPSGSLYRKYPKNDPIGVSGECLTSWVYCYTYWSIDRKDLVKKVATSYLANCFGVTWERRQGVSARSSNGGLATVVDGWPIGEKWWKRDWGIMQPITGPAFFTSQALLALASKELGGLWHLAYYLHWLICGGWFYSAVPVMFFKTQRWYYAEHITAMNLWVLNKLKGGYKHGLKWIAQDLAPAGNAQPWITGFAWSAGAIDEDFRQKAIKTLESFDNPVMWPQNYPKDDKFLYSQQNNNYMVMASAALHLKHNNK